MADRKDWLEVVLKRKNYNESPLKVIAVEDASDVVGKGENYLSKIERVRATVLLGSGKTKQISLIVKNQHETEQMKKLSLELGVFFREITMYRDVLPKMEDLLDEINDNEGIIWGRCYDYRLYDRIVFEDLGAAGYKMADRKKQLGLEAALLVVKNLAKFHALSKILLDRGELPLDILGKHIWTQNPESTIKTITENAERLINVMKTWGDEWQEAADRFQKALPDFGKRFVEELDAKPDEFNVLCHGDCWTNNMLFKGDDLEKPTSVKFVDMQFSSVTSPARDLHYFVVSSLRLETREHHLDRVFETYAENLRKYASALNYRGFIPGAEAVKQMYRKKSFYLLSESLVMAALAVGETENIPEWEDCMKSDMEARARGEALPKTWSHLDNLNPISESIVKYNIKLAMSFGVI